MSASKRVIDRLSGRKVIRRRIRHVKGRSWSSGRGIEIGLDHGRRRGLRCAIGAGQRNIVNRSSNNPTGSCLVALKQLSIWIDDLSQFINLELPISRIKDRAA